MGRTWLSATEQIGRTSDRATQKWQSFSSGVLLAPALAVLTPGPLSFKAIVAAAAAAQCAYYLAKAEFALAVACCSCCPCYALVVLARSRRRRKAPAMRVGDDPPVL